MKWTNLEFRKLDLMGFVLYYNELDCNWLGQRDNQTVRKQSAVAEKAQLSSSESRSCVKLTQIKQLFILA